MRVIVPGGYYSYDSAGKKIWLAYQYYGTTLENIEKIKNLTRNKILYDCKLSKEPVTVSNGCITHSYPGMEADTDKIQITLRTPITDSLTELTPVDGVVTLETDGKVLVLPTANAAILPLWNETVLSSNRLTVEESPFGGLKGTGTADHCPGTLHAITSGISIQDTTGANGGQTLSAGRQIELGLMSVDTENHTITQEFIISNSDLSHSPTVIDPCNSTTGWGIQDGTGTITTSDSKIIFTGNANSSGAHRLKRVWNVSNSDKFFHFKIKNSQDCKLKLSLQSGSTSQYIAFTGLKFPISANTETVFVFPMYAPAGTSSTSYPSQKSANYDPTNIYGVYIGIEGAVASSANTLEISEIWTDNQKTAYVELQTPDTLAESSLTIQAYNSSYATFRVSKLNSAWEDVSATPANCKLLDGSKLDDLYGTGNGHTVYPKSVSGATVSGSSGTITYSGNQGTKNRIGLSVDLPPSDGGRTNNAKIQIKTILSYADSGNTIYEFEDSTNASYGLQNLATKWLALCDPGSPEIDFFLFSFPPKNLSFVRDETGEIISITLYPGNGMIYHGRVFYADVIKDSNFDTIPDCFDATLEGSVTRFLQALSPYAGCTGANPTTPKITNYTVPAMSNTKILPASTVSESYISDTISISACRGQYQSASFVLNSDTTLNATVAVSDFVSGENTIAGSALDIKIVKCWYQANYLDDGDIYFYRDDGAAARYLTPEILLKDDTLLRITGENFGSATTNNISGKNEIKKSNGVYVDISTDEEETAAPHKTPIADFDVRDTDTLQPVALNYGKNKQFWITAHIPDGAVSGDYTGTITISSNATVLKTLSVSLHVYPFTLLSPNIEYSIYYCGFPTTNGSVSCLDKTSAQLQAELSNMLAHGITNPLHEVYGNTDELINILLARQTAGMSNTNIYYSQYGTSNPSAYSTIMAAVSEYGVSTIWGCVPEEQAVSAENITKIGQIHTAGGKVYFAASAAYVEDVAEIIDLAIVPYAPNPTLAATLHGYGNKIYSYANPQTVTTFPGTYRLNYGLLLWQNDYDGALTYAYQQAYGDAWNEFSSEIDFRGHMLTYPTSNGVVDTVQFEGFREGINDMRYLATLQAAITANPGTAATTANDWLTTLKSQSLTSADLDEIRAQMIDYILAIEG